MRLPECISTSGQTGQLVQVASQIRSVSLKAEFCIVSRRIPRSQAYNSAAPLENGERSCLSWLVKYIIAEIRTFFVTSVTNRRHSFFKNAQAAELLINTLYFYRAQGRFELHEFPPHEDPCFSKSALTLLIRGKRSDYARSRSMAAMTAIISFQPFPSARLSTRSLRAGIPASYGSSRQ